MATSLYRPIQSSLAQLLGDIELGKLALPDLQRPFVWKRSAVRDLFDSMYQGFPVGSLMLWTSAQADSRYIGSDGKQHTPTEFIIDGQQRLTGLYAVIKGTEVTFKDFSKGPIKLAFRPRDGRFEVMDASVVKDPEFLADITPLWTGNSWEVIDGFIDRLRTARAEAVEGDKEKQLRTALNNLQALANTQFQAVQIGPNVDEEQVAEIFMRVNSGGTELTQADFILTLMSVFREDDRRRLEDFAEAARLVPPDGAPSPFNHLVQPSADQLLRVAVLVGFRRGQLQSVLALLRGAGVDGDPGEGVADRDEQFATLATAIDKALDLTSWHEYLKAVMAGGFRRSTEITSANNIVLVYALYLIGRSYGLSHSELRTPIAKYFFMSSLTGRYTGSFETQVTRDVQQFTHAGDGSAYLAELRRAVESALTEDFWTVTLPRDLATSAGRSPALSGYAASLCILNARVPPFVSATGEEQKASLPISALFDPALSAKKAPVERHHLFPRRYLEAIGISGTQRVNQIANLAYVEWPENIEISDTPPAQYWPGFAPQFSDEDRWLHALPDGWEQMDYEEFLEQRRAQMARVIKKGFETIGSAPAVDTSVPATPAVYLHPDRPFANEAAIRQVVAGLSGHVFWYEQHMDRKVLDILHDALSISDVDDIRLMSGPANITKKTKSAFARFAEEMQNLGVRAEWRVIAVDRARQLHARVVADDEVTFEVPPLNSVLAGTVDSIHPSEIPMDAFEAAWANGATALADVELT